MINATDIDITSLPALSIAEKSCLPDVPAIYFAISAEQKVIYIGKTQSLRSRWVNTHHLYTQLKAMKGVRIAWIEVSDSSLLDEIEIACITHFNPILNKRYDRGRTKLIGFFATESEKKAVHAAAHALHLTMAEYIRLAVAEKLRKGT